MIPFTRLDTRNFSEAQPVDLVMLKGFNNAAISCLVLYLSLLESDVHFSRLRELDLLQDWLLADYKLCLHNLADEYDDCWWPDIHGPDICATCYHFYGMTLGGRVREGCYRCRDTGHGLMFYRYTIRDRFYVGDQHCEYLIAYALWIFSRVTPIGKARAQSRTMKYVKEDTQRNTNDGDKE